MEMRGGLQMKKLLMLIFLSVMLVLSSVHAFAADSASNPSNTVNEKFEITGGIDKTKEIETTFDSSRTISGIAPKGTEVLIEIYEANKDMPSQTYNLVIGSSGYFSQIIDLSIGENTVVIAAQNNKNCLLQYKTIIKRKKSQIKSELVQNIAFPILTIK